MTIKDDVLAAFEKLDANDDALWNKDGTPKLEAIRNAADDQKISRDEMIGSIGDKRRPAQKATPAQTEPAAAPVEASAPVAADPDAGKEDTVNVAKPATQGVEDVATPDKVRVITEAKAALAELDAQAAVAAKLKDQTDREVNSLEQQRQAFLRVIEETEEHLTHAESVKRVQQQTQKNLAANKERVLAATTALASAGLKTPILASPLDAAYAMRKKSPEQAQAQALHIRQQLTRKLGDRMGTV